MGSVTVRYDRASARRHQRVSAPARVEIDGRQYPTRDWSVGGFCVVDFDGDPRTGEPRPIRFYVNFQGFEIGFEAQARVCAHDASKRSISAEFVGLGQRETELLRHFVMGVSTGEMTSVSETLVHMDSPVSVAHWGRPPLAGADPLAQEPLKKKSRLTAALYFAVGPVVAGYVLLTGYQTLFRMDIENAVVVRPTETVVAQGIGYVESMQVKEGDHVVAGQPLFTLMDNDQGRDLEDRKHDLDVARVELQSARTANQSAKEQLRIYQGIARHKQQVAAERVKALEVESQTAEKNLVRVESIVSKGLDSQSELDNAKALYAREKGELDQARPELEVANDAVRAADRGSFYDGYRLIDEGPAAELREQEATARVKLAEEQVASFHEGTGRTTYRAPFTGRVVRATKSPGSTVDRGETLALLERVDDPPRVFALLTQDQVTRIRLGQSGTVRVPMVQQRFHAVVIRTDKAGAIPGGVLTDLLANASKTPRPTDPSGYIELELPSLSQAAKTSLRSGMPAIVNLPRAPKGSPSRGLSSWLP
jgi:multidrug resistance efflux pump